MRRFAILLLLVGIVEAKPIKAPHAVKTSQEAVEIARTRGKLIFLTVIVDNDGENRAVIDMVFRDREFLKISKEFVILYANNDDDHRKVRVRAKSGKKEVRCGDCPSITCFDHMTLAQSYARGFFPGTNARTPIHFVIDANEDVVATIMNGNFKQGFNHVAPKTVVAELKKLLKKHGRGLTEDQYKTMMGLLTEARAARARDKTTLELQKLTQVVAFDKKIEGVETARARIKEIDKQAAKELAKLDDMIGQGLWEESLDELERIEKKYPGTFSAGAAAKRRAELDNRREVKRLVKSRDLYEAGMKYKERKKLEAARKRFAKCVRLYPETRYAELAKKELEALAAGG